MLIYGLVPGSATSSSLEVWVGVMSLNEMPAIPANAELENVTTGTRTPIGNWLQWQVPDGSAGLVFARVVVDHLQPRKSYDLRLLVGSAEKANASASTLPDALPGKEDRPFTLMLGSCFCAARDGGGTVGKTFASLPQALRPEMKLLCGDQVYLDSPFYRFLLPHSQQDLAETFLKNYINTWTQGGDLQGFQKVLTGGAAWLSSDDHEFWNNAPYPSFSVNTWTKEGRCDWWMLASGLYDAFQMPSPQATREYAIGDLRIFIADTRIERSADRTTFLNQADMDKLVSWVKGLTFPAILVIGQPIFDKQSSPLGKFVDWNLPDFEQYQDLCRVLFNAPQSIIVLTGDVHFGRVARTITHQGIEVVEVIASPMSLVSDLGKPSWQPAPQRFPSFAVPGIASSEVKTIDTWDRAVNHFLLLELWQEGARLAFRVRTCETDAQTPPAQAVFEYSLGRAM
jgi:hypothetical protein